MIHPAAEEVPRRKYLLLVTRLEYPFVQRLWAENREEVVEEGLELLRNPVNSRVRVFHRVPFKDLP